MTDKEYLKEFDKKFCTTVGAEGAVCMRWCKKDTPLVDVGKWLNTTLKAVREEERVRCLEEKYGKDFGEADIKDVAKFLKEKGYDSLSKALTPPNN